MAYRVAPFLGAYREQPLLGENVLTWAKNRIATATKTAVGPAPWKPVSSPTQIVVPMAPAPRPIAPINAPMVPTIPNTILPVAPNIPPPAGSAPQDPAGSGGGGGGGSSPSNPAPADSTAAAPAGDMPGWVIPVAIGAAALLFLKR